MQTFSINHGKLKEVVHLPPSKSYANRALILAALAGRPFLLKNLPVATDVTNLLDCFKQIGLRMVTNEDGIQVLNSFPDCESKEKVTLTVGEGGTTARFLAAMLLLGKSSYDLILGDRLKDRPWGEFIEIVSKLGGKCQLSGNTLQIQGPVSLPEVLEIDCKRTTQFASAFQLLSISGPLKVIPVNLRSSQSYWAMTEKMLREFIQNDFYSIPLDWSSASYPLAFAALNQEIIFPGLSPDPYQADSKFFDLLRQFECVELKPSGLKVKPLLKQFSVNLDVADCLDLVPTLGYFLSHIEGKHELFGIENLVHKESDRLNEVLRLVRRFHRRAECLEDKLVIWGKEDRVLSLESLSFPDDHRLVMSGSLFLLHHSGGSVSPAEAVKKSYPDFFELISSEI